MVRFALTAAAAVLLACAAMAQTSPKPAPQPRPAPVVRPAPPAPPAPGAPAAQAPRRAASAAAYEQQVRDLSTVLGRAHYIRILCNGRGDQTWMNAMRRLLDVEAPGSAELRAAMADSFNAGFRDEEERFPECTATAQQVEGELRVRGKRLADGLAARHRAQ